MNKIMGQRIKTNVIKIPKVYGHDLALTTEGIGSNNNKEYCNCNKCEEIRKRRDAIYNKPKHKIKRWCNMNF